MRKIIHIDMDAFYASVEQRDDPTLRGKPVIVAWRGPRSVVCAASYEARKFGVRSAMPAIWAERLCPEATFVAPDFSRYRAVSRQIRAIFGRYTDLIEPLSLDEAYLDVSKNKLEIPTATKIARAIRADIRDETSLTASAGVAPNKFLAKIASDWRKPDGLFVIQPQEVENFLAPLPVGRLPGVGKATEHQLQLLGISTVRALRLVPPAELVARFGRYGERLHGLANGRDDHPVETDRPLQQISVEHTLESDLLRFDLEPLIRDLAPRLWLAAQKAERPAKTLVLKLKTAAFQGLTRSATPAIPPRSAEAIADLAVSLLTRVDLAPTTRYRLIGLAVTNLADAADSVAQRELF
jgi:DNA polymerase IV